MPYRELTYQERKAERTAAYKNKQKSLVMDCSACSGSGRYDARGSPKCGACEGTGKEEVSLERAKGWIPYYTERLKSLQSHARGGSYWSHWDEAELKKINKILAKIAKKSKIK